MKFTVGETRVWWAVEQTRLRIGGEHRLELGSSQSEMNGPEIAACIVDCSVTIAG